MRLGTQCTQGFPAATEPNRRERERERRRQRVCGWRPDKKARDECVSRRPRQLSRERCLGCRQAEMGVVRGFLLPSPTPLQLSRVARTWSNVNLSEPDASADGTRVLCCRGWRGCLCSGLLAPRSGECWPVSVRPSLCLRTSHHHLRPSLPPPFGVCSGKHMRFFSGPAQSGQRTKGVRSDSDPKSRHGILRLRLRLQPRLQLRLQLQVD